MFRVLALRSETVRQELFGFLCTTFEVTLFYEVLRSKSFLIPFELMIFKIVWDFLATFVLFNFVSSKLACLCVELLIF